MESKSNVKKEPAHNVILGMIEERFIELRKSIFVIGDVNYACLAGEVKALISVLEKMVIPEKHQAEVIDALRQIKAQNKAHNPRDILGEVLSDKLFLAIAAPAEK